MSNRVRNIALIVRPIHLFNVYEYIRLHPNEDFDIFIELNSHPGEREVLKKFSKLLIRDGVTINMGTFLTKNETLRLPLFYLKVARSMMKKVKYHVFLTSVGIRARMIYKFADFEKIVIMDEGNSSIKFFPPIVKNQRLFAERHTAKKLLKMMYRMMNIHELDRKKPIEIFTIYKELLSLGDSVTLNEYNFVKEMFKDCVIEKGTVIILGTHYKFLGFTTERFSEIIREKLATLDNVTRVIYKHHKLEGNSLVDVPGVEVLRESMPVEYYFLETKKLPEYIICFNSAVGGIMPKINSDVKVVNIKIWKNATVVDMG